MDAAPRSLAEAFARVPDPRGRMGRRFPLPAVLNLLAVAMMAGAKSLEAVCQFGRDHGAGLAWALGFRSSKTPCKAALSNLLRRIDVAAFEATLSRWVLARGLCPGEQVCIDGKALRGSAGGGLPGVHLLAAYAPELSAVIAQVRVAVTTNEHKAALELLGVLPLAGVVITADAAFCQRDVCEAVLRGGGDYLMTVKDNQPALREDIKAMFEHGAAFSPLRAGAAGV